MYFGDAPRESSLSSSGVSKMRASPRGPPRIASAAIAFSVVVE